MCEKFAACKKCIITNTVYSIKNYADTFYGLSMIVI